MATHVFYDASVTINAVDLSDHVKSVTLNTGARMEDDGNMGDDTEVNLAGIKTWSVSVEFSEDFAAGEVDATLFPLVGAAAFAIAIRPTSAAASATNPEYGGNVVLSSYNLGGAWGDKHAASAEFASAGSLTRGTGA